MASVFIQSFLLLQLALFPSFNNNTGNPAAGSHPLYMSVAEIDHNAKEKILEITVKIYTDDFEKTLRKANPGITIDLAKPADKAAMDKPVFNYLQQHFQVAADGKAAALKYIGYEIIEDAVNIYVQADNIATVKKISVTDNILYEYKDSQFSIIHAIVGGNRKSSRISNPDTKAEFSF